MSFQILIVDDEAVNRELLDVILQKEGYTLFFAENGKEALSIIDKEEIDLMLLDLMMPEMNGVEVMKKLTTNYDSQPKIIIVTALQKEESQPFIKKYTADGYITKPYDILQLKQDIRNLLETKNDFEIKKECLSKKDWENISIEFLKKEAHLEIKEALMLLLTTIETFDKEKKSIKINPLSSSQKLLNKIIKHYL